jgi:hypothetical protein
MLPMLAKMAGPFLLKFATQEVFKQIILLLAEMAVKSTKTKYDDKFYEIIKKAAE